MITKCVTKGDSHCAQEKLTEETLKPHFGQTTKLRWWTEKRRSPDHRVIHSRPETCSPWETRQDTPLFPQILVSPVYILLILQGQVQVSFSHKLPT